MQQETVNVFIAYAREDDAIKDRLKKNLAAIFRNNPADSLWDDGEIHAGDDWNKAIHKALEQADIFLLLVSPDFIASDFCYETEMQKALEKHQRKEAIIVPLIVRACSWQNTPLKDLKILPEDGKPIHRSNEQHILDELYLQVTEKLNQISNTVKDQKRIKKLKVQFDITFRQAEEEFKNENWEEALFLYEKSLKIHDNSFEQNYDNIANLIELCKKQVKFKELVEQAKTAFENNEIRGSFQFVKEALEINVSIDAKTLLEKTAKILYVDTIKKADAQFLNMNWNEAYKRYESAFKYINEANLIVERKIIRRRDFSYRMVSVLEKIEKGDEKAKERIGELLTIAKGY